MKRDFAPQLRRSHDKVDARCGTFYLRRGDFSDMNGQSVSEGTLEKCEMTWENFKPKLVI